MQTEFETAEAVDSHYAPLIEQAEDDSARLTLRAERAEALAEVNGRRADQASLQAIRIEALQQYPNIRAEDARGSNREEILANAKAANDHVQAILDRQAEQRRQEQDELNRRGQARYGSAQGPGATGTPPAVDTPLDTATNNISRELAKTRGRNARQQFDFREIQPAAEDAILDAMAARQQSSWARQFSNTTRSGE